jgi:intracellular sulfur oxidation DsrE/DsrF family protein
MNDSDQKNTGEGLTDEFLNSFVDGELAGADRERAFSLLSRDEAVKQCVCELRGVGELVRHAYDSVPALPARARRPFYARLAKCAAVCGTLLLGAALAWTLIARESGSAAPVPAASASDVRIMMHLSSGDPDKITEVLSEAESALEYYRSTGQRAEVEVIANGDGINLLLASSSSYADRVKALRDKYPNLRFSACRNTLERFADNGFDIRLQPGIGVVESGVAEIIQRRSAGWAYLRV